MIEQPASVRPGIGYRTLAWFVAIAAVAALAYGFTSTNLFAADTWSSFGMVRFSRYTRTFALVYLVLAIALRRYIALSVVLPVVALTIVGTGAISFLSVLLLWVSCAVLGRWIFRTHTWALGFLGGLCMWALAIALLAKTKVHYAPVYVGLCALVLLLRRSETVALFKDLRDVLRPVSSVRWATLLGFGAFLYAFLAQWLLVWKPETGGDALAMHLAIALDFANNHVYTFDYHRYIWALAPMGADFCYAAAAVMGGELAARLLNLVMFGTIAYLIFRSSQRWVPPGVAYLLAALFVSAPLAQMVTGSMFVENFTAALAIGAMCALWEFYERPSGRALCLCAFLLGSGIGWKLGGIAVAVGLLPFLIQATIHSWNTLGRKHALVVAGASLLFLIPALLPYVKAYVLTGNPVFPFGNSVFTSPLIQDNLVDYRFHQPLTWRTLFDLTFYTSRYYEGQDGSFAFQYLFLLPLSLVAIWKMRSFEQRSVVIAGFIAALAIASTQPNARYFYPALPLLMVGGAAVLGTFAGSDRRLFGTCIAVLLVIGGLNVWFLPTSNWYHREFYLRPLFSERGRLEYLRSSNPVREVVPYVNSTTGGVLFVQNSDIAGVRQPVFSNNWHNLPFRKLIETARNAEHFYRIANDAGIERYVKQRNPTKEDVELSPALFEFLDLCGEPEFETGWYVVLRTASNCAARLDAASPRYTTRVFPPGKYNDSDTRFTYLGRWDPGRGFDDAFGGTVSFTDDKSAEIRFEFNGSAFIYGFTKAFNRGRGQIWIDGKAVDVLDQYSPRIEWQAQQKYTVDRPGRHSVAIRVTGEKDSRSKEPYIDLDFLIVEP